MVDVSRVALAVDSRQVRSAKTELMGMQAAGVSAQKSMVALGASIVALGTAGMALTSAVRTIADFDTALRGLQAVSKATSGQMADLEKQARELGATTSFSASEAANAQRFLAMAGLDVNEVLGATPGILKLAIAGQLDLAQAADLASNVLGGFRLEVDQLNRVNNVLAATASSSNTSVEQLGAALSYAAPIAAAAGISIEETAAAIGVLGDAGLQGTRGGTGFTGVIRQLSLVTPKAEAALAKYGITVDQVNVETRGFASVLDVLKQANLSAADAIQIFGSEAGPAGQVLANGSKRLREFSGELQSAEGNIDRMAEIMGQGLAMSFKEFQSAVEEAVLVVGRDLGAGGQLESAVQTATDGVRALAENMDVLVDAATAVAIVMGSRLAASATTSAASMAMMGVQTLRVQVQLAAMQGVSARAAVGMVGLATATRGVGAAMAFFGGPIGLGITAVAGAVYYLSTRQSDAEKAAEQHEKAVNTLNIALSKGKTLTDKSAAAARDEAQASISVAFALLERLEAQLKVNEVAEKMAGEAPIKSPFDQPVDLTSDLRKQIAVQVSSIEELRDKLIELNKVTGASFTPPSTQKETIQLLTEMPEEIQSVIDALEFERQQLGRTDREQAVYTALKRAGIDAANDNASAVRSAALALYDMQKQLNAAEQAQKDFNDSLDQEFEGWKNLDELIAGLERERQQASLTAVEIEKLNTLRKAENLAKEAGISLSDQTRQKIEQEIEARSRLKQLAELKTNDFGSIVGPVGSMNDNGVFGDTGPFSDLSRYEQQMQKLQEAEDAKLEIVRSAMEQRLITEQEGQTRITEIQAAAEQQRQNITMAANSAILMGSSNMFGDLATIMQGFAGKSSGAYKALFAVSKAFAIADSIIKIQQGLASALSLPWPANLAAMGSVAAAGASIMSSIQAVQATGFKDGGLISGPGTGRSDSIPIMASNGEFMVNAEATRRNRGMLEAMNSGGTIKTTSSPNVMVKQYPGVDIEVQQLTEDDVTIIARRVVRQDTPEVMRNELSTPNSKTSSALSQNYQVSRKR